MNKVLFTLILFGLGHALVWVQLHGQFLFPAWKNNPWPVLIISPLPALFFWKGTKFAVEIFNLYWASRFIGFSVGILIFAFFTFLMFGEAITFKTLSCIMLACAILLIQMFL